MYAIIRTGGKQFKVQEGDVIDIEKLAGDAGAKVEFDEVLFVGKDGKMEVGTPTLKYVVKGEFVGTSFGPKLFPFKFKRRCNQQRKMGHRQQHSRVKITKISAKRAPAKKSEGE